MGLLKMIEREGGGKDDLEFSMFFQETKRGEKICSEDRQGKKIFRMECGCFELSEMLHAVNNGTFGSGVQTKGQDNKELLKT